MAYRTVRIIPDEYLPKATMSGGLPGKFNVLSDVTITNQLVSISRSSALGTGKQYSDADLRLLIAEIEVAKEHAVDDADKAIRMLTDILAGKEQSIS